ncbi:hypothetical protein FVEG_01862 [Fusarium verticillioides 7600]|uniref:Uncharacterized protein n=1 Tax=Gibberella moniliformis (strain M3125 / FGSC 7600) TaxID=334819 RepID=W7LT87_GIBM7|nr:hypothetical protein FVEG_01862 [Fusarium verticillioides 7600]EWG38704.1 hypothetical protein FVEG_01862 [Fusarium verticillioides 7600]
MVMSKELSEAYRLSTAKTPREDMSLDNLITENAFACIMRTTRSISLWRQIKSRRYRVAKSRDRRSKEAHVSIGPCPTTIGPRHRCGQEASSPRDIKTTGDTE